MANPTALSPSSLNQSVRVLVQNTIRNAKSDFNLVMTTKGLFDTMQRPYLMTEWGLESKRVWNLSETEWTAGWVTGLNPKLMTYTNDDKGQPSFDERNEEFFYGRVLTTANQAVPPTGMPRW